MNKINLSPEFLQGWARKMAEIEERKKFPAPELHNFRLGEITCRTIWNRIFPRPKNEHLHEFIFHALFWKLGDKWYKSQKKKPFEEQHIIVRWEQARYDFLRKLEKEGYEVGKLVIPTGEVRELLSLASDMYFLQLVNEIPKNLTKRLKSLDGFQGARYEIAVAASLVRAGFEIQWIETNSNKKTPEFNAFQSYTKETIAIEAKSRHRKGTLHEKGDIPDFNKLKLDIFGLYSQAMEQNPNDKPFGVFIEINLPRFKNQRIQWKELMFEKLLREGISIFGSNVPNFLAITNCAWHYDGVETATNEEFLLLIPDAKTVKYPLQNEITYQTILRSMNLFAKIPEDKLK